MTKRREASERGLRIVSPNGHLGFGKTREGSFLRAIEYGVDYLVADAGSCDIGPMPLGSDGFASPTEWVIHDLEMMLRASREHGLPMVIGSAGDAGSRAGVDKFVGIIQDLAESMGLEEFKIGYFYSDVDLDVLRATLGSGALVRGLDGRQNLMLEDIDATSRAVAVASVEPYIKLLEDGADVIIGGRSSDCAVFAAMAMHHGYPEALSYYTGKVLECASFCAEPYGAKESVVAELGPSWVDVTAMSPEQACTPSSVASHAMYERSHPYHEYVAGGMLDMSACEYVAIDERTTRVTGPEFVPSHEYGVKIEGSGFVGHRFIGFAGIRDGYTISQLDAVLDWARNEVEATFGSTGYELHFHVYGRDAILKDREPTPIPGHEVGIVVDATDPDSSRAKEICMTATRQLFYARLPEVKGTAGGVSYLFDEVLEASPAYRWTINHVLVVHDWTQMFEPRIVSSKR